MHKHKYAAHQLLSEQRTKTSINKSGGFSCRGKKERVKETSFSVQNTWDLLDTLGYVAYQVP